MSEFTAEEKEFLVALIRWWFTLPFWKRVYLAWKYDTLYPWR